MMINWMKQRFAATVSLAASGTLLVALVGGAVIDGLWLALVPAVALLFLAVGAIHAAQEGRDGAFGTLGAALFRTGCVALLASAVAGFVVMAVRGVEPGWLSVAALVSGAILVTGELAFGVALAPSRTAPRAAAILFATAIPIGVAIDVLPRVVLPVGLFFTGVGVYVGLGLLALSLARLGRAARRPGANRQDTPGPSIAAPTPDAVNA